MELWFSAELLKWYKINKRDLPWREEKDPYKIWISEIILQQTQVAQGLAYYYRFIQKYPQIGQLAMAEEDEVLKLWQGLGYYSRARNLHETAKNIQTNFKGLFPKDFNEIRQLKGIGDYTASAIASFAFDMPYAVLDGNVYRLLSRLFGINTPIDTLQGKKEFSSLATALLNKKKPAIHNQAIMEFGSQFCKPVNPNCTSCIFNSKCVALKNKLVNQLPIKLKKTKVKKRYFNYFVLIDNKKQIIVEKRNQKDIWKGLFQFPMIETNKQTSFETLVESKNAKGLLKSNYKIQRVSKTYKHVLTHQLLFANFYILQMNKQHSKKLTLKKWQDIDTLAFPRLIEIFLKEHTLQEIN